jgi:hypothetical protein
MLLFDHQRTFNRPGLTQSGFRIRHFRLDGFFWGRPQPFWNSFARLVGSSRLYTRAGNFVTEWWVPESGVTLYDSLLLRMFVVPSMIVADVEKVDELLPPPA